ncbi:hypothetical protein IPC1138_13835 [Pseudomonas aeruginosa]|nr:hypothetical protein IPC1138_13835 [Pseudomonas aeruginosa]
MVIVQETYILAVQVKALRDRLTISEDTWFLETDSRSAPARSGISLQPPPTFTCAIRPTATSLKQIYSIVA